MHLFTERMTLIAATSALTRAEISDRAGFAAALRAAVPDAWPPESLADALPFFVEQLEADPSREGWMNWYGLVTQADSPPFLAASGGFIGKPSDDGMVEIGYSVLPDYQRRGLATEMVEALAGWALARTGVLRVVAHVHRDNEPSQRVLRGADFAFVGDAAEADHLRFERGRDCGPVLTAKPFYLTSIPADAEAVAVAAVSEHELPHTDYFVDDEKVGCRYFEADGVLTYENAYQHSRPYKHAYTWHCSGAMHSCETFDANGLPHGTAYQWASSGRLVGSYSLTHGTGVDLWWSPWEDGTSQLSEIHMMRGGSRHGYEWWLDESEVPYSERHWRDSMEHGIEREWNSAGRLKRGYPRYWISGQRVRKDRYLRAAAKDDTLPPFRPEDSLPARHFPPEVEERRKLHSDG